MLRTILTLLIVAALAVGGYVAYEYYRTTEGVVVERKETPGEGRTITMEHARKLLQLSKEAFKDVKDYKCIYQRDEFFEQPDGKYKKEENVMELSVRHEPFTVLMAWSLEDKVATKRGRKLVYPYMDKKDKMFVYIPNKVFNLLAGEKDIKEGVTRGETRHTPDRAGLQNMLNNFESSWAKELSHTKVEMNETKVEYSVNGKSYPIEAIVVTTYHPVEHKKEYDEAGFRFYKTQLYLDKKTRLPVEMRGYFWPKATPGADGGKDKEPPLQLMENFVYLDVRTNLGLEDKDFDPKK
jgi:hypothetical protein